MSKTFNIQPCRTIRQTRVVQCFNTISSLMLLVLIMFCNFCTVQAFVGSRLNQHFVKPKTCFSPSRRRNQSTLDMYVHPDTPTSKSVPMVAKAIFTTYQSNRSISRSSPTLSLSSSVLSSSNTLPSFPTAHGLLSPETVLRMEQMTSGTSRNEAVEYFLNIYRSEGPMACLPLLSDSDVLPSLTEAMRDVIS